MSYFIAAISNKGGAPEQAYSEMQAAGACPEKPFAEMFKFEVPSLTVGTLDTLMVSFSFHAPPSTFWVTCSKI